VLKSSSIFICLLYYLGEIYTGIHIYQFTFYTSVSGCGCGFGFEQKYLWIDGFGDKKAQIGGFAYPYLPSSIHLIVSEFVLVFVNSGKCFSIRQ